MQTFLSYHTREDHLLVESRALPTCQGLYSKPAGTRALVVTTVVLGAALRSHSLVNLDNFVDCWNLLLICDGLVAAVTDSHFKLEAHERDGGALGAALAADGLPALAAVVLGREQKLVKAAAPRRLQVGSGVIIYIQVRMRNRSAPENGKEHTRCVLFWTLFIQNEDCRETHLTVPPPHCPLPHSWSFSVIIAMSSRGASQRSGYLKAGCTKEVPSAEIMRPDEGEHE